jgi:crossover junction endodeoxyribonuclease RuvC
MRVLGIDPGSVVTGFGVVETVRGRVVHVASGCVRTRSDELLSTRLLRIHDGLVAAFEEHKPDAAAIEAIFHHKNAKSALLLGQARGVALLAAGRFGLEPAAYAPATVKQSVGAHGAADKEQVSRMVAMLLGFTADGPADVTDALAIAITHCAHARNQGLMALAGAR